MPAQKTITLSIIIPSYNEKNKIAKTLESYCSFFENKHIPYEIIVADYSTDGSKAIIRNFIKTHPHVELLNIYKLGKGYAIFRAFNKAKGKYISFVDADNAMRPKELYRLFTHMNNYDAVIGSRALRGAKVVRKHDTSLRRAGRFILNAFFVRILFGMNIMDTQCGAKIFVREKIRAIIPKMRITNSIFDVELMWRFGKIGTIKEIPITWIDSKDSHFRWKEVISEFYWLFRVRLNI